MNLASRSFSTFSRRRRSRDIPAMIVLGAAGLTYLGLRWFRRYSVSGRTVVITGGSRGLGLAMAREFLKRGARVALVGRDADALERASQQLRPMGEVTTQSCDVRDQAQVESAFAHIREQLGPVEILVNNAGTLTVGPMDAMTSGDFQEALDVFFWGPFHTTLAALPDMRRNRSGRIVNISSIGGKISVPHLLPYSVGKFALAGFSEGIRPELMRDNIYVTTAYPGLMRTGSPRNAEFKSKHRAEYTWFLLSDSIPGFSISADRAARQIIRACEYGQAEKVITFPAKFAVKLHQMFPEISSLFLAAASRGLPQFGGIGRLKAKGMESESALTQSWLTALDQRAAEKNNQIPRVAVNL